MDKTITVVAGSPILSLTLTLTYFESSLKNPSLSSSFRKRRLMKSWGCFPLAAGTLLATSSTALAHALDVRIRLALGDLRIVLISSIENFRIINHSSARRRLTSPHNFSRANRRR